MASKLEYIKSQTSRDVATFDVEDIFSAEYDVYKIHLTKLEVSNDDYNWMRVINASGSADTSSNYVFGSLLTYAHTGFAEGARSTGTTTWSYHNYAHPANYDDGAGSTIYIFNPFSSSDFTSMTYWSLGYSSSSNYLYGFKGIGIHKSAESITGLQWGRTGTFQNVKVDVYGVAK